MSEETKPLVADDGGQQHSNTGGAPASRRGGPAIQAWSARIIPVPIVIFATLLPTVYIWVTPLLADLEGFDGDHFRWFAIRPDVQVTYAWPDSSLDKDTYVGGQAAKEACEKLKEEDRKKLVPWHKRHHKILSDVEPYDCSDLRNSDGAIDPDLRNEDEYPDDTYAVTKKWMCGFKELYENKYRDDATQTGNITLSNYISISSATGMMACLFFFPAMFLWISYGDMVRPSTRRFSSGGAGDDEDVEETTEVVGCAACSGATLQWSVFTSLFLFQIFFGLFLALPVLEYPNEHFVAVALFLIFMAIHFVLRLCANFNWVVAVFCFLPACGGIIMIALNLVLRFNLRERTDILKYGFWMMEVSGLTAAMWFAPLYLLTRECDCGCGCCCRRVGGNGAASSAVGAPVSGV